MIILSLYVWSVGSQTLTLTITLTLTLTLTLTVTLTLIGFLPSV